MGRPTKLTPDVQKAVCDAIAAGNTRRVAAAFAGVAASTLQLWLAKGCKARSGQFLEFSEQVRRAEATAVVRNVAIIQTAAQKTWRAAAWWLERRRPKDWALTRKVEHSGPQGANIPVAVSIEDIQRAREELEAWEREHGAG